MRVIILTGNETRHIFFRNILYSDSRFDVIDIYAEDIENSLENRIFKNEESTQLEKNHVIARTQSEYDFFKYYIKNNKVNNHVRIIPKGSINSPDIVSNIIKKNPDLLICYGASLINSKLLTIFEGRFLNVHLGLSPYYRGSGSNIWPLVDKKPHMVGATFMFIDQGIDTGNIIHQITAEIFLGDGPHSIGNRLIMKMTYQYADIISCFNNLESETQPAGKGKLFLKKHFDNIACEKLYSNFKNGLVENYLNEKQFIELPYLVKNKGLIQ